MKSLNYYITEKLIIRKSKHIDNWLRFTSLENSTISLTSKTNPNVEYSFDGKEWIKWDYSNINLDKDQIVYMRGDNPNGFNTSITQHNKFVMTGKIEASGNIMSLLYKDDFEDKLEIPCNYCFYMLFSHCTSLTQAPELPATKLSDGCYRTMFAHCTSLTQAPELPATELADYCYQHMFYGCTSLVNAPALPATILGDWCYRLMFYGCESLTQAPELPATKLTEYCYYSMFDGCTSLTQAPELPATKLANECYCSMFERCTSLKQKPKIATDINNDNCKDMFKGCPCEND